ncbi:DUF6894 family protein [Microvirga roseola]|uniref:DUF6894 family protein n=1 Tax=Microvirga roseola TaxID=2883126 RepID=UPI001E3B5479|nr:hypothetical protein [Microvirga roseola]
MPHFYFDVSVGNDFARDDDGLELDSLDAAKAEAMRAAAGIGHDSPPNGSSSDVTVQVMDEQGQPVLTVAVFVTAHRVVRTPA